MAPEAANSFSAGSLTFHLGLIILQPSLEKEKKKKNLMHTLACAYGVLQIMYIWMQTTLH